MQTYSRCSDAVRGAKRFLKNPNARRHFDYEVWADDAGLWHWNESGPAIHLASITVTNPAEWQHWKINNPDLEIIAAAQPLYRSPEAAKFDAVQHDMATRLATVLGVEDASMSEYEPEGPAAYPHFHDLTQRLDVMLKDIERPKPAPIGYMVPPLWILALFLFSAFFGLLWGLQH